MPTYQYQCKNCGHELEELQSFMEPALVRCPKCNTDNLARVMGSGAGLIFKGSGFYLTDYKKEAKSSSTNGSTKEEKKPEKKDGTPPTTSSDPKPPTDSTTGKKKE